MDKKNIIYAVGIGPGSNELLTLQAENVISSCDVVIGYSLYLDCINELIEDKDVYSSGMTREIDRCRVALQKAAEGKTVAVVSSGDAGIYGMAGLLMELLESEGMEDSIEVQVVPGITAASAAASLLGAPLMNDYASISLSDLMTPADVILKRVKAVAECDLVCVLYNPKSKKRIEFFTEVINIFKSFRKDSYVGIVRNAYREVQEVTVYKIDELPHDKVDMKTVVIIGNSNTVLKNGKLYTQRGYTEKYL